MYLPFYSLPPSAVQIFLLGGFAAAHMRNSVAGVVSFAGGLPMSDKPGGGTGIKNVLSTVQAAGGMLQMKQKGAEFITGLVLPL